MFFDFLISKKRLNQRANEISMRQLVIIESNIKNLEESCSDRAIISRYDSMLSRSVQYSYNLTLIMETNYDKDIQDRIRSLLDRLAHVSSEMNKSGRILRERVVRTLDKVDYLINRNVTDEEIKEALEEVYDVLKLEHIEHEETMQPWFKSIESPHERAKRVYYDVSYRQICVFNMCIQYTIDVNAQAAVHALDEFVDNCHLNIGKPLSAYERLSIKHMIDAILHLVE